MLPADKILKQFTKFNPTSSVCPFYQKHNFLQFCPDQVCQLVLCEHVKSFNRLQVMVIRRASDFIGDTKTDTKPTASGSFVETGIAF